VSNICIEPMQTNTILGGLKLVKYDIIFTNSYSPLTVA